MRGVRRGDGQEHPRDRGDHLSERPNREGLTFEEFWNAAQPADRAFHGFVQWRVRWSPQMLSERRSILQYDLRIPLDPPRTKYKYGTRTRTAHEALRRAWDKGEDPTEWRAWAEKQLAERNAHG